MVPSDPPLDENNDKAKGLTEEIISEEAESAQPALEKLSLQKKITIDNTLGVDDIQLDEIEGLNNNDFSADTLEFESVSRRPKRKNTGLKVILLFLMGYRNYLSTFFPKFVILQTCQSGFIGFLNHGSAQPYLTQLSTVLELIFWPR